MNFHMTYIIFFSNKTLVLENPCDMYLENSKYRTYIGTHYPMSNDNSEY